MSDGMGELRTALVVLGMHRSGTSAMARVLSLLGAQLPNDLLPAGLGNEQGHWESKSVVKLDDEILEDVDSGWDGIFAGRRPLSNFDLIFRQKAGDVIKSVYDDADLIVLKDPRINVLSGFWDNTLRAQGYDPVYVTMVRNPLEVAASLLQRDKTPTEQGLFMWLDNMLAAERNTRNAKRLFIAYDDLLRDWRGCLDRIERTAGIPFPSRTSAASNAVEEFLSPSLKHQRVLEPDLREVDSVQGIALQAYAWFKTIASEQDPVDPAALDRVDEYLSDLHDRVGPIVANYRSQLAGYRNHAIGLEGALTHFRNELGASQARHQDAVNQAAKLEARHEEVLSEVSRLQATADSALAHSLTLENELSEASADRERLAAELEATKSELAAARKQLIDAESNTAALSDQILALGARVDSAENARREADRVRKAAEEGLAAAGAEIRALHQQREEIFQSTTWRLTALPRRVLSKLRGG